MAREADDPPVTELLTRARAGDSAALDQAFAAVYEELRRLARARRRQQSLLAGTLDTTALVHEAYLKLCRIPHPDFRGREHFLAVAASAMRQILVDGARRRLRVRRGGGAVHSAVDLDRLAAQERDAESVLAVHGALERLARVDARLERVIVFRFFGGMTESEAAAALDCSDRTIRRDWIRARAWLRLHLEPSLGG